MTFDVVHSGADSRMRSDSVMPMEGALVEYTAMFTSSLNEMASSAPAFCVLKGSLPRVVATWDKAVRREGNNNNSDISVVDPVLLDHVPWWTSSESA